MTVEFIEFIFGSLLGVTLTFPHPFADAPAGAMDTALSLLLGRFARRGGARLPPPAQPRSGPRSWWKIF